MIDEKHLADVDEWGIVHRYDIETYYSEAKAWTMDDGEPFARVILDNGGTDMETRLTLEQLEAMASALRNAMGGKG